MPDALPPGTSWAYGVSNGKSYFWDTPQDLCGLDGCVYLAGHRGRDHSWANELVPEPHHIHPEGDK